MLKQLAPVLRDLIWHNKITTAVCAVGILYASYRWSLASKEDLLMLIITSLILGISKDPNGE